MNLSSNRVSPVGFKSADYKKILTFTAWQCYVSAEHTGKTSDSEVFCVVKHNIQPQIYTADDVAHLQLRNITSGILNELVLIWHPMFTCVPIILVKAFFLSEPYASCFSCTAFSPPSQYPSLFFFNCV